MKPGCIGKTNTNNLPAPTDLTENPYGEKNFFCFGVSQKSASVVCILNLVLEYGAYTLCWQRVP